MLWKSNFVVIYLCLRNESKSKTEKHIIIRYLQGKGDELYEVRRVMKAVYGEHALALTHV